MRTICCRVVARVRVELGGSTGVLDREIAETEENREATGALAHAHVITQKPKPRDTTE